MGHTRLALISLELEDEGDEADEGNDVYEGVRFLDTRNRVKIDTSERNLRPVSPLIGVRGSENARSERVEGDLRHLDR